MIKGTLAARVAAIAAARAARASSGPLSAAEAAELERLTADDRPDTANMTDAQVEQWLHDHSIDGSDPVVEARVAELKARRDRSSC